MEIREAVERVIGQKTAAAIIADEGLHWAVVAAMAGCTVGHGPEVKKALREYVAEMKRGAS